MRFHTSHSHLGITKTKTDFLATEILNKQNRKPSEITNATKRNVCRYVDEFTEKLGMFYPVLSVVVAV
jgi:hypothetical protein